jgi:hypothetical protein
MKNLISIVILMAFLAACTSNEYNIHSYSKEFTVYKEHWRVYRDRDNNNSFYVNLIFSAVQL